MQLQINLNSTRVLGRKWYEFYKNCVKVKRKRKISIKYFESFFCTPIIRTMYLESLDLSQHSRLAY